MLDNKFFLLLVNFLWMIGLFGTLFTIIYTIQQRRRRWWNVGHSNNVPRTLVPLYLALTTLCLGLMLHAYMAESTVAVWIAGVWALLALLFLVRFFSTLGTAIEVGWDAPLLAQITLVGWSRFLQWPTFALLLLLANVALLGWWGNQQLSANSTDQLAGPRITNNGKLITPFQPPANTTAESILMDPRFIGEVAVASSGSVTATTAVTTNLSALPTNTVFPAVTGFQQDLAGMAVVTIAPEQRQATTTPPIRDAVTATLATTPVPAVDGLPPLLIETATPAAIATQVAISESAGTPVPPLPTESASVAAAPARVQSRLGANLRAAPTTRSAIRTLLANRSPLTITGRTLDSTWLAVRLEDGMQGWISAQLVAVDRAVIENMPVTTP